MTGEEPSADGCITSQELRGLCYAEPASSGCVNSSMKKILFLYAYN